MKKTYFTVDEDFEKLIKKTLKGKQIISLKLIDTGWTNIVYEAHTDFGDYFFRFPRNDFWVKALIKDSKFTEFIYDKTSFHTVKLELHYDENRPFSVHKKIEGETLADKIEDLSEEQLENVACEVADFMAQLHHLPIAKEDNWICLSDFLDELANTFYSEEDKVFWKRDNFADSNERCFVHGDLNNSNILLDDKNRVTAIIDFGFAGFGDKYSDVARVLSRVCPEKYKKEIVKQYEIYSKCQLDKNTLENKIDTWKRIDQGYIHYMETQAVK